MEEPFSSERNLLLFARNKKYGLTFQGKGKQRKGFEALVKLRK